VTEEPQKQSAAATAAEKVRAIVEAAERSAAELEDAARAEAARIRADAERDAAARLGDARLVASRLAERAGELERQVAAVRASIAALEADLRELRAATPAAPPPAAAAAVEGEPVAGPVATEHPDEVDKTIAAAEAAAARGPDVSEASAPDAMEASGPDATEASGPDAREARGPDATEARRSDAGEALAAHVGEAASPDVGEAAASGRAEGARVIALNMALGGTPREQTARYLAENFELEDPDALLDDVYSRAGG
jgi:hypothetical protein